MATFWIIVSIAVWVLSVLFIWKREVLAPIVSCMALYFISLAKTGGLPVLPINNVILIGWTAMTFVVVAVSLMQPPQVMAQTRGLGYMTVGAFVGMAVGLLGYTLVATPAMLNGIMIVATIIGLFFGYFMYTHTPDGAELSLRNGSARFFRYLLAKGFPVAITVMIIGVACVCAIAQYSLE